MLRIERFEPALAQVLARFTADVNYLPIRHTLETIEDNHNKEARP
jgi:hypothetical protein